MYYKYDFYKEDLKSVFSSNIPLENLEGCSILITGASGLIGSYLVDSLMLINELYCMNIDVFVMSRNKCTLSKRFETHVNNPHFYIIQHDVKAPLTFNYKFDYIIHAASNAYPYAFSTDPVGTIMGNIWGVHNLLEYARSTVLKRFVFISSGEVYGEGTKDKSSFEESYSGYVDNINSRSCYPNSKRTAETLCVSYSKQYGIDTVIARPCHIYGPTATTNDNRVTAQFINNVLEGKNIVMKGKGTQLRSYCYVADCVSGILTILLKGEVANAYNIANSNSVVTIREMAEILAAISGKNVMFELPEEMEKQGYNPVSKSVLNSNKLEGLDWTPKYDMKEGLIRTINILEKIQK